MMAKVLIKTTEGDITVRLYDETPQHRDNFLKLAGAGYYDGTLFHRVIKDFMIQGGDPDSIGAPAGKSLGVGGPGYTIEAEILPGLFHKRGALCAARQGDDVNPEKRSSGSQFYIVWGKKYSAGELRQLEKQLQLQQERTVFNGLASKRRDFIMKLRKERDMAGLSALQDELLAETHAICASKPQLSAEKKEAYANVGGTPFLDGQYTVFGEVETGIDIVGKIQETSTGRGDRPVSDIKVVSMEILE
ncbi:MAG: peptidylprolyl isomerase [Candidatus Cryptobacteroides sp.]